MELSVQDYTTKFDDLTLCCEVQEDSYQVISRYRSSWGQICSELYSFTLAW